MITKLHKPHPNLPTTLRYNFSKVEKGEASVLYSRGLGFSSDSEITFKETKDRMYAFLPETYRTVNITFHASINPHKDDNLSDATMEYFIDDYMEELGYGKQPYIVFKHEDIDRTHYHVVSLNVDKNGEKINDRFLKKRSWEILKKLSAKYGIKPPNQHIKEDRIEKLDNPPTPIIYKEGDLVNKIKKAVDYAMEIYRPKSIGELSAILYGYNISLETINKKESEEEENGLLFYIIGSNEERLSAGIKASDLGHYYLRKQLEEEFKMNKKSWKKKQSDRLKYAICWALRNAKDPITFSENLKQLGVYGHLIYNKDGRLYGATFIDSKWGIVCNGSDIGKEYSAHALNEYFNGERLHEWVINNDRSEWIRKAISSVLKEDLSLKTFIGKMKEKDIDVMVQRDKDGKILHFVFADNKHHVLTNSTQLGDHYSTILLRHYFEEGGENFWTNDAYNSKNDRVLFIEEHGQESQNDKSTNSILDEIIDSIDEGYSDRHAESIGRMYQRRAERNWNKGRRR